MTEIVLMSDPRIAAIPVVDCGEKLIDVRLQASIAVDPRKEDRSGAFAHLREGVLARHCCEAVMMSPVPSWPS
ncbi:hypothetical protein STAFG_5183 [Streptomyces afghaniensis 772]|uniref:Uncharacterized protein n=1 Tax=Streptomyces afghaniensis 772 TaxID=1283301 RepID=S4MVI0_9ACTN|nr:hypothetical protein STAFG_5183 [Streptomyces afghaniensis 772]